MASRFEELLNEGSNYALWMAVAQAAYDRSWSHGIGSLTQVQRLAVAVWVASGQISNRGFFDHTSDEMDEWAAAYDALGMPDASEAIRQAAAIMPTIDWDGDDPTELELDPIEKRFYLANEQTEGRVAALIRKQSVEAFAGLS